MTNIISFLGFAVACIVIAVIFVFVVRWFSSATINETVFQPTQDIKCVKLVSSDGVAVDCWRVKDE